MHRRRGPSVQPPLRFPQWADPWHDERMPGRWPAWFGRWKPLQDRPPPMTRPWPTQAPDSRRTPRL